MVVRFLWLLGGVFALVGLQALLVPMPFTRPVEIVLASPSAYAEVRAGYGGLFTGAALLFFWGARAATVRPIALTFAAWTLGVFAVARLVSLWIDGAPNAFSYALLGLESLGFVVAMVCLRARRT